MTAIRSDELVRVSVHGPAGRADVAVPMATTVADLLPVLLHYTSNEDAIPGEYLGETAWVLHRMGQAPLDPDGTPETLDWLTGEQFYLRPADRETPDLVFDDVADGMATAVGEQRDRWQPKFNRWLFLAVGGVLVAAAVLVTALAAAPAGPNYLAVALAVVGTGAAATMASVTADRDLVVLLAGGGAAFAWVAGVAATTPVTPVLAPHALGALGGGLATGLVGGFLLAAHATFAPAVPVLPVLSVLMLGVTVLVGAGAVIVLAVPAVIVSSMLATVLLAITVIAPRLVLRLARLHGPQLPRTSDELQIDVDPLPAGQVTRRTSAADRYLSVLMIVTAATAVVSATQLLAEPGWPRVVMAALVGTATALRARVHLTIAQRVALAAGGIIVAVRLAVSLGGPHGRGSLLVLGILLIGAAVALVAALRPVNRRSRPVWGHLANLTETLVTLALVPTLLQILGVFAWARGLAG